MEKVEITTEFIKLDQFLKWAGIAENGGAAKAIIQEGNIKVNGNKVLERGKKLHKGDTVTVEGHDEFIIV